MNFTKEYKRLPREVMETPFLETYLVKALNLLLLRCLHYRQEDEPGGLLTQIICDLQSNTDRNWKLSVHYKPDTSFLEGQSLWIRFSFDINWYLKLLKPNQFSVGEALLSYPLKYNLQNILSLISFLLEVFNQKFQEILCSHHAVMLSCCSTSSFQLKKAGFAHEQVC